MSYSRMVLEQIMYLSKRDQRPGYQNILEDARSMSEQSDAYKPVKSSMVLPTRSQLDAFKSAFAPGGEVDSRLDQMKSFTSDNDQLQSTVRSIGTRLDDVRNLSASDLFDYERGLGKEVYNSMGSNFRNSIEFADVVRRAIPSGKRAEFDSELASQNIPGMPDQPLTAVSLTAKALRAVDKARGRKVAERADDFVNKAITAATTASSQVSDDRVNSTLGQMGVEGLSPEERAKRSMQAAYLGSIAALGDSPNPEVRKWAKDTKTKVNPKTGKVDYQQIEADAGEYIKRNASQNVVDNLLSMAGDTDVDSAGRQAYNNLQDTMNRYIDSESKRKGVITTFNDKIVEPNVQMVQRYTQSKKTLPAGVTPAKGSGRGTDLGGYYETLSRMGR